MADEFDTNEGLTRREALKKGAMLGGALVWAVPVVQTVGMSAAFAAPGSEADCCVKPDSLVASVTLGNYVSFILTVTNCSTQKTAFDVIGSLQRLAVVGGVPDPSTAVNRPDFNIGDIPQANSKPDDYANYAPAGTWVYRSHVTYECPVDGGPRLDAIGGPWIYSNQVTTVV